MKFYIASPFFTDDQIKIVKEIEDSITKSGYEFFSPRLSGGTKLYKEDGSELAKDICFLEDTNYINNCDGVILNPKGIDSGTYFEMGYAISIDKPVVIYNDPEVYKLYKNVKIDLNIHATMGIESFVEFGKLYGIDIRVNNGVIYIKNENPHNYKGVSKILIGYLYSKLSHILKIVFFDKPRKSNLMLSKSIEVYEYENDTSIDNLIKRIDKLTKVEGRDDN